MPKRKTRSAPPASTLERLRRRLREAEETLAAIRNGHVEALVVHAPDGEQIFTLHSADQPYRLMVEQMREGAVTVGADGAILYCNQRFADMVGVAPEHIPGQALRAFVDAGDESTVERMLQETTWRAEVQLKAARGQTTPAQLSSASLVIGDARAIAVVLTDLTHERLERGLRESNRLKDEFLATLSHELRTPLNVIAGWTRMLLADQLTPDVQRHALELIDRNASLQAQLVNDLVDMSGIATGKLQVELEPLPLIPALEAAIETMRPSVEKRNLTLETAWHVHDAHVLADRTRLQQVVGNLLSNAVKFTPAGGTITVSADRNDDGVQIEVTDTGIGIDPAFLPYVFHRFRQADSATTRRYGGLGLGLAIVHDLVRLHGGRVVARSAGVGQGATFVVTLQEGISKTLAGDMSDACESDPRLEGHRVLLLEDHADSRELMAYALRNSGATVLAFAAAREAYAALDRVRPSVIVADLGLPGEDGLSFMRRVRAHPAAAIQRVPAIAVTAHASARDRAESLSVGFQQHLTKPIDPDRLIREIHALVAPEVRSAPQPR